MSEDHPAFASPCAPEGQTTAEEEKWLVDACVVVRSSVNKGTQFFEAGERTKCFQVNTSQHSPTLALTYLLQLYLRTAQRLVARRAGGKWRKQLEKVLRESCDQGAEKGAEHLRKQFDLMVVSADLVRAQVHCTHCFTRHCTLCTNVLCTTPHV
jgi:hypothetical protein